MKEIHFNKYETKGVDYHFDQINKKNWIKFNAYVLARYQIELNILKNMFQLVKLKSQKIKILDIGCGEGVILYLIDNDLKEKNIELFGIDSSTLALDVAKRKIPKGIFKKTDVYNLPFKDDSFDIILSSDVIEHVLEPKKMLSEIKRVGKNRSFVIIGTPIRYTENPMDKSHYHEFFPQEFKKLILNYFTNAQIIQSHKLEYLLLYNKISSIFKRKILLYRNLINFYSIYLKKNPFLKIKTTGNQIYSYMFCICRIKKNRL